MKESVGAKTILFPTPALVIGTYDKEGRPNAMTAAWAGICCSSPPAVSVSLRKATYTYGNILERKAFTVNVPSEDLVKQVDYFGIASGREEDKIGVAGMTALKGVHVDAPYIDEFPMVIECRLIQTAEIGLHTIFVGEIIDIRADISVLGENGFPDIEKVRPITFSPSGQAYYGTGHALGKAFSIGKEIK